MPLRYIIRFNIKVINFNKNIIVIYIGHCFKLSFSKLFKKVISSEEWTQSFG